MSVDELLRDVETGNEDAQRSAAILGILIEQKTSGHSAGAIEEVLGSYWVERQLTDEELHVAVDRLLRYVEETALPDPMAVWVLTKSRDPRLLDCFVGLLDRFVAEPDHEHLVYQALTGIIPFSNSQSLEAVRRAARLGSGAVKETADQYLEIHGLQ